MASVESMLKAAAVIPHVVGLIFSALGNLAIILDIARRYQPSNRRKPSTYHRLMLGLTCCNFCSAVGSGLSTWPMPVSTGWGALGTEGTCKAQAFWIQVGVGSFLYNLALSVYYYLFIVKNMPSARILAIEKWMHPICLLFAFGTAFASLGLDVLGPATFWCWIEQGENGQNEIYRWLFWYGPLWACIAIITILMVIIFRKLREQDARQAEWAPRQTRAGSFLAGRSILAGRSTNISASERFKWQSIWYTATFYITWIPLSIVRGIQAAQKTAPWWIVIWAITAISLWGFLNYVVYMRPRYKQYRKENEGVGFVRSVCEIYLQPCRCGAVTLCPKRMERADGVEEQNRESESDSHRKNRDNPSLAILPGARDRSMRGSGMDETKDSFNENEQRGGLDECEMELGDLELGDATQ